MRNPPHIAVGARSFRITDAGRGLLTGEATPPRSPR